MPRVVHFELPVDDPDLARTFYSSIFGWEISGSPDEGYWLATTGSDDEPGIHGALIDRSELHAAPVLVVGVDSLDDVLAAAEAAGADVLLRRQTIPSVGYSAYLRDPEGNVVGLFQDDEQAGQD